MEKTLSPLKRRAEIAELELMRQRAADLVARLDNSECRATHAENMADHYYREYGALIDDVIGHPEQSDKADGEIIRKESIGRAVYFFLDPQQIAMIADVFEDAAQRSCEVKAVLRDDALHLAVVIKS